jgi:cytochrome c556
MKLGLVNRSLFGLVVASVLLFAVSTERAMAADKSVIEYRAAVLSGLDAHIKAVGSIVDGKVPFVHHLPDHAVAIVGTSRGLLEIFPERMEKAASDKASANKKKDAAVPFEALAVEFNLAAARLVQVIPTGDKGAIKAHYEALTKVHDALLKEASSTEAKADSAKAKASGKTETK